MSEDNNVVAPGLWFSSPLKLDVCKGSFQAAPLAPAVEPEPIYTAGEITDPAFYREPALPLAPTPPEPDTARLEEKRNEI